MSPQTVSKACYTIFTQSGEVSKGVKSYGGIRKNDTLIPLKPLGTHLVIFQGQKENHFLSNVAKCCI